MAITNNKDINVNTKCKYKMQIQNANTNTFLGLSIVFGLATSLEASNVTSLRELLSNILQKGEFKNAY